MTPTIVAIDSLKFAGLKTLLRSTRAAGNDMRGVPALWQDLAAIAPTLPSRIGQERYAVITGDLPDGKLDQATYHALFAVEDFQNLPPSLVKLELSWGRLAKFRHKGSPQSVGMTAMKILREWLPRSNEQLAMNLELFIYPPHYDRNDPHGEFEYALILK